MWLLLTLSMTAFALDSGGSLAKLIELAEQNSPTIVKSRLALDQARLELKTARMQFLPTLDFEGSAGPLVKNPDSDHRPSNTTSSASLVLKESFYDNGASITKYKKAARAMEREFLEYQLERDKQLLDLTNTYYDWSSSWQDRQISDSKRDLLKRQFNVLEAQYKQGLKTKRDVLRIETEVRKLQIDLLKRDNDLELTLQRLAALAGVTREDLKTAGISSEEAKLDAPIPSGPWPPLNAREHRRVKTYALQGEEAELDTRLVERKYWPELALTGKITNSYANFHNEYYDHHPDVKGTRYWEVSGLVTLTYNLWDWGTRSRALQISRIKEGEVQADTKKKTMDLDTEIREVWLRLKEFSESVKMTKELLTIEQQSYNILEAEYRNGRATYLDLITNLNSLIEARSKFASTFFALKKQQASYAFHKGTLYEDVKPK
jgi:outer membrane protein